MTYPTSRLAELDPEAKRALLAKLLQDQLNAEGIEAPLSYGQQAMWFLHELAPESRAYNVAFSARVRSTIDPGTLNRALQGVIERHAPLRTTYAHRENGLVQVIHGHQEAALEVVDASGWDDETLNRAVRASYETPFDLEQVPVFRACLFTRAADDHILLLTAHHIAIDGWSIWILLRELGLFYAAENYGGEAALPPLARQYADFVRWEAESLAGAEGARLWDYWREELAGDLPVLDLSLDQSRPKTQTFNGATLAFEFGDELCKSIRALARTEQTTVYAVLLAAYQVLLHRYSGQDDIVVGSPMAGRSKPEYAGLVGDFINVVVLRADLSGAPTYRSLLEQARGKALGALAHQDFPFALLVHRLAPRPDPSRSPIFQAVLNFQNIQQAADIADLFVPGKENVQVNVGGLLLEPYPMPQQEGQLDLTLQVIDASGTLFGSFQYNTDLFEATTIERMARHYKMLLAGIVAQPDQPINKLPMLTAQERRQVLVEWNATQELYPADRCIHQLIEEQVERTPNAIAVEFEGQSLTYGELNSRANQLACHLVSAGVSPEVVVGICLERSLDMLVALLAVHKAGGAYLPLDPTYPVERLRLMMDEAQTAVLITNNSVQLDTFLDEKALAASAPFQVVDLDRDQHLIFEKSAENLEPKASSDNLAYIIYTSGSTGRPKGIEIEHRSLVSFLHAFQRTPGVTADDVVIARTTMSFDPSMVEIFLPLMTGARIVLVSSNVSANGEQLRQALETSGATILQVTPTHCRLLLAAGWQGSSGIKLLVGGEPLTGDLVAALLPLVGELWNVYGPTETTVWATVARITDPEAITVGGPIDNFKVFILDSAQQPTPVGVVGELHIGGPTIARGYRNRPALTEQNFVMLDTGQWDIGPAGRQDVLNGAATIRLYRTGDLARYKRDGAIELLGRADNQVKVRGFRVELGEIEVALSQQDGVRAAVVLARGDTPGNQRLVAYVQPEDGATIRPAKLRRRLKQQLPDYMVPAMFVPLDEFPLTPSGKVNRQALPAPEQRRASIDEQYAAPETPTEQVIARIWSEALSIDRVGVYDNYFDLGGDSLRLVEVMAALEEQTGVRLNPAHAQTQTLGQLAFHYDEMIAKGQVRTPSQPSRAGGVVRAMRRMLGARAT